MKHREEKKKGPQYGEKEREVVKKENKNICGEKVYSVRRTIEEKRKGHEEMDKTKGMARGNI